jgi:hypothetical protein
MTGKSMAPRVDPKVYEHPKTLAVSKALGIRREQVVYHLTQLWGAVLERKTSGFVIDLRVPSQLREWGPVLGHDQPGRLFSALRSAGFLDQEGAQLWVHDLAEWQGLTRARKSGSSDSYRGTPGIERLRTDSTGTLSTVGTKSTNPESSSLVRPPKEEDVQYELERAGERAGAGEKEPNARFMSDLPKALQNAKNPFGQFMWWLVDGFGYRDYKITPGEATYFKNNAKQVDMALAAETYIAIAEGLFGDNFDRRVLTGTWALKKVAAFHAFKRRRGKDVIIPLTADGAAYYPITGDRRRGLAGGDAGASTAGTSAAGSPASGDDRRGLESYTKQLAGEAGSGEHAF